MLGRKKVEESRNVVEKKSQEQSIENIDLRKKEPKNKSEKESRNKKKERKKASFNVEFVERNKKKTFAFTS